MIKNKLIKNKKGIAPIALVMAVALGIIFLVFFAGGGLKTTFDISKFIASIPTFVWIFLGIFILILWISRR